METRRCTAFALAAVLLGFMGTGVEAATDEEKREEAARILDDHFGQNEDREWTQGDTFRNGYYQRYELTDRYCGDITCWEISAHVRSERFKDHFPDKIFLYSYDDNSQEPFLGAEQDISELGGGEYDLIQVEGLERPCIKFCEEYFFGAEHTVMIEHTLDPWGSIRVKPEDTDEVDIDGGIGALVGWDVHKVVERPEVPELIIPPGATPQMRNALEEQQAELERLAEEQEEVFFKFESVETGQYLRITSGDEVDARGGGGGWTLFRLHEAGDYVKLESKAFPGSYIAVDQATRSIRVGTGGTWCRLKVFKD